MAHFYVGTSGWAYPSWKPDFYPQKLAQSKFLGYYATRLNAVEVNFSFRQLVKETTIQKWLAETPESFRFTMKAHQVLTHIKRLKDADEFLKRFLATLEPMERAKRLGPILFQLPPNLKADQGLLSEFLHCVPRGEPPSNSDMIPGSRNVPGQLSASATSPYASPKPRIATHLMRSPPISPTTVTANRLTPRKSAKPW